MSEISWLTALEIFTNPSDLEIAIRQEKSKEPVVKISLALFISFFINALGSPLARGHSGLSDLPAGRRVKSCRGGDGWRSFEPIGRLSYRNVDRIIRKLRRMYQENPTWFEIPTFARKVY